MPIFNAFTAMFNERVESFIVQQGSTLEKFIESCEDADEQSFAVQLILSITDFDAFKQLMIDQKAKGKYDVK
jgi:hypothetical protein